MLLLVHRVHASMKPGLCSSAVVVPQLKSLSTETDRDVKLGGDISCCIMTCDIFGTGHSSGQTNILALCNLFGKTYNPVYSSATQVIEIKTLDQISTEEVIDVSTHVPLKALMIPLKLVRRGILGGTQYRNTVRKIGKYRNTKSKMDEIPIPHL